MNKSKPLSGGEPFIKSNFSQVAFNLADGGRRLLFNISARHVAFTLAEILITLAIIGIVAALTIPSLVQSYKQRAIVTALKKTYATLSQAYNMALYEKGSPLSWNTSTVRVEDPENPGETMYSPAGALNFAKIMSPYLKIAKNCGTEAGCWYDGDVHTIGGTVLRKAERRDMAKVLLSDGTMLAFGGQAYNVNFTPKLAWLLVDVNGKTGPNKYGYDIYEFFMTEKGIFPYGLPDVDLDYSFAEDCLDKQSEGHGCTTWVLINENLDYLKCDDLSWAGKHKCSD